MWLKKNMLESMNELTSNISGNLDMNKLETDLNTNCKCKH
jgi:hypothetical protein